MLDLTGIGPMTTYPVTHHPAPSLRARLARRRRVLRSTWRRDVPWALAAAFLLAAAMLWATGYAGPIDIEMPLLAGVAVLALLHQVRYQREQELPRD